MVEPRKHGAPAEATMKALQATFNERKTWPSLAQWVGLNDLANHLEGMAESKLKPLYYLSSLDPGVGKTTAIIEFTRLLLASAEHRDVSVLICLGRLAEIESLVGQMGLGEGDYSVVVGEGNDKLNAMGNKNKTGARVMFTTQQLLESKVKRGLFSDIKAYHYNGSPRLVRVWDEACLPARPICINVDLISAMLNVVNKTNKELRDELSALVDRIEATDDGGLVDIPNFEEQCHVDLNTALGIFGDEKRVVRDAANGLWLMSGKTVIVRRDFSGKTALDYENTLPDDLKPVVICDASGRVRNMYRHWTDGRGDLVKLQHGTKNYANMTVHVWRKGGGKSSWNENWGTLLDGIAKTINSNNEPWLVVHHKIGGAVQTDIPEHVRQRVKNPDRVRFLHWGDHSASNEYRDIKNVILAGTLFYEPSYYEAMGRLSRGTKPGERLSEEHYDEIKAGEHANNILQAACRGSARKSEDNGCAPCDLYIIADLKTGVEPTLSEIFPGCVVRAWEPVPRELTGHVLRAHEFILGTLAHPGRMKMSQVRDHLGIDKDQFNKDVLGHRDFEGALAAHEIYVDRRKGRGGSDLERRR